jgi:hypothetical protein
VDGGDDYTIVSWNYGDGATGDFNKVNGLAPKHTYGHGTWTVTVSAGGKSASTTVTVQ